MLIDAADDTAAIQAMLHDAEADSPSPARVAYVATTHSHWDHVRALREVVGFTGTHTAAGSEDGQAIDVLLEHGDTLALDGFSLEVLKLRGDTPGSAAFLYRDPGRPGTPVHR